MHQFRKNQAALNVGDPVPLTRIPPELSDAAVAQWEQAPRLSQQVDKHDDNAAMAHLQALQQDTEGRARPLELREKEWDLAARVRECALEDTPEKVTALLRELATDRGKLQAHNERIADLESQIEHYRR